jgi:putative transposase
MPFDRQHHHRRSIRLPRYNYSQEGTYFVTICTYEKSELFGDIVDRAMIVNQFGQIVQHEWEKTTRIRQEIELDVFVVMPNHIYGIVVITTDNTVGAHGHAPLQNDDPRAPHRKTKSLGAFIAGFKCAATKRINAVRGTPGKPVWQRNYYEHIIRDDAELKDIQEYILTNPLRWSEDRENPEAGIDRSLPNSTFMQ